MFLDNLKVSFLMVRSKPVRSILSLLGIYIGVLALVLILGIREGLSRQMRDLYRTQGANVVFVHPGFDEVSKRIGRVGPEDILRLQETRGVLSVLPRLNAEMDVRAGGLSAHAKLLGIDAEFIPLYRIQVIRGRIFLPEEVQKKQPVCLLSADMARKLFPLAEPVGSSVDMQGTAFQVIGVVEWDAQAAQRTSAGEVDILVPQPWTASQDSNNVYPMVEVRVQSQVTPEEALRLVTEVLSHGVKSREKLYFVRSMEQFVEKMKKSTDQMMLGLLGIAAISLFVGAIGVANVMVTSVTERTREVGIRKALGARRTDILMQFLVESSVLSISGGILAVTTGAAGISIYTALFDSSIPMALPVMPVAGCLLLTVLIGKKAILRPVMTSHAAPIRTRDFMTGSPHPPRFVRRLCPWPD